MIQDRKIDLALEAKELAEGSAAQTTRLAGVKAQEDTVFGYPLTRVEILNREGEAARKTSSRSRGSWGSSKVR